MRPEARGALGPSDGVIHGSISHDVVSLRTTTNQATQSAGAGAARSSARSSSRFCESRVIEKTTCSSAQGDLARTVAKLRTSQRSLHNAPIFRLLLKVAVNGTHQCDFHNFCGTFGPQQCKNHAGGRNNIETPLDRLHGPFYTEPTWSPRTTLYIEKQLVQQRSQRCCAP